MQRTNGNKINNNQNSNNKTSREMEKKSIMKTQWQKVKRCSANLYRKFKSNKFLFTATTTKPTKENLLENVL